MFGKILKYLLAVAWLSTHSACFLPGNSGIGVQDPFPSCAPEVFAQTLSNVLQPNCGSCHGQSQNPLFANENLAGSYQAALSYLDVFSIQATNDHCFNPGCNLSAGSPEVQELQGLKDAMASCESGSGTTVVKQAADRPKLVRQFRRAALRFCDRTPSISETLSILDAPDLLSAKAQYDNLIDGLLTPSCLKKPLTRYHRDLFEAGSEGNDIAAYVRNAAAMLGAYVVAEGRPYQEVLTANYCILQNGNPSAPGSSSCYVAQAGVLDPQLSGIMTNPFIHFSKYGNLHFRVMNFFSTRMMGQPYPDPDDDDPLDFEKLPQTPECLDGSCPNQPVNFRNLEGQVCKTCHVHLNQRAGLFWVFNSRGTQQPVAQSVAPNGQVVNQEALQVGGAPVYKYYGAVVTNIEELAQEMVKNNKYFVATARHMLNYADGKTKLLEKRLDSNEKKYAQILKDSGGNTKIMLQQYLKSEDYTEELE